MWYVINKTNIKRADTYFCEKEKTYREGIQPIE